MLTTNATTISKAKIGIVYMIRCKLAVCRLNYDIVLFRKSCLVKQKIASSQKRSLYHEYHST